MPKYTVITTLTTHFEEAIEASSEEEAREIYQDMIEKDTISIREIGHGDAGDFYINEIFKGEYR